MTIQTRRSRRIIPALLTLALLATGCSGDGGSDPGSSAAESPASGTASSGEAAPPALAGDWQGAIEIPGSPLEIGITFTDEGGSLGGTIDIPVQGIADLPLQNVAVTGSDVTFAIPDIPGEPAFRGTLTGDTLAGDFTQSGQTAPFSLARGTLEPPDRPQEPQPPFPYQSEDVTYRSDVDLAGTLTLPAGAGPFPAVLLITGSGAQDRDESLAGHKPFLLIADTLTRAGIAVLRVDDRGVGGSGGDLDEATYADLTDDVVAGLEYLKSRPEIRPDAIGLLGHSEGGYIAPLAAQQPGAQVAFVVLMAGPAVSGEQVLIEQNRLLYEASGADAATIDDQVAFISELARLLRAGDLAAADELIAQQVAEQGGDPATTTLSATPNLAAFVSHDPAPSLAALTVPVLSVFGGRDLQVPAAQSEPIMRQLLTGNADATVQTFANLNHLMQPATTGVPAEFAAIETTIDPAVLQLFSAWITERVAAN